MMALVSSFPQRLGAFFEDMVNFEKMPRMVEVFFGGVDKNSMIAWGLNFI